MKMIRGRGIFQGCMTDRGAEAWVGERRPTTWPEGYKVAFYPTVLLDPDGRIVAKEGDLITFAGGHSRPMQPEERGVRWAVDAEPWVRVIQGFPRRESEERPEFDGQG